MVKFAPFSVIALALLCQMPRYDAVIRVPKDYDGKPTTILYWLHGRRGIPEFCPHRSDDYIVIAPRFHGEADWKNFDLPAFIHAVEKDYPASDRQIEGYSRGAYGAVWHASRNPGLFSKVTALAGAYPDFPKVQDELVLMAGKDDSRWLHSSIEYGQATHTPLILVDSDHNPNNFYKALNER